VKDAILLKDALLLSLVSDQASSAKASLHSLDNYEVLCVGGRDSSAKDDRKNLQDMRES